MYNVWYIIYNEEENKVEHLRAKDLSITVSQGDIKHLVCSTCGQRCHRIYASGCLNRDCYSEWLDTIRAMLCYKDSDKYINFI